MTAIYFEDFEVGQINHLGSCEVVRDDVIDFASKFDPQPFHLDDVAAQTSHFGRLSASGWHTASMAMRLLVDFQRAHDGLKAVIAGAGVDGLRWMKPVYPGDTLSVTSEILEATPSRSKSDRGVLRQRLTACNQDDEPVMTMITTSFVRRRPD